MKKWIMAMVSAAMVMILATRALAAEGESVVNASGTATMPRRPDVMRLRVEVNAEGKTMKDALAKMTERRNAIKKKFSELGAAEGAVEFGDAKEAAAAAEQNPMQRMMRMQRGGRKPPTPAKDAPKPVKLAMTVKAEWPIKSGSADEVLAAVHELQEKIRAADVGESKKMTPEQQEEAEENDVNFNMTGEQTAAPGEPVFLFVSKINAEDRDKALASAFAKAKESAGQLAKAAGKEIGTLRQLNVTSAPAYNEYAAAWQRYQAAFGMIQESYGAGGGEMNEVVGPTPEGMSFKVMVTASFALK